MEGKGAGAGKARSPPRRTKSMLRNPGCERSRPTGGLNLAGTSTTVKEDDGELTMPGPERASEIAIAPAGTEGKGIRNIETRSTVRMIAV